MLFNSFHFLFFFVVTTISFFLVPYKLRWFLLLGASCYFYMAFVPIYILILGFTIVIDYAAGILIENSIGRRRFFFLTASLCANIGVLCLFKYYNFISENISFLLDHVSINNPLPYLSILLPIGLSFHTFQAMSYTIEVYRGNQKAERHFGIYALYVMFYPQLVAGPIERPQNLLHQFETRFDFNYDKVVSGLHLMVWGIFKKVVIADRLAIVVDRVYQSPDSYNSLSLFIAIVFFSFQIFCDFSAYSDIALGAARVMGFELMNNFDRPYHSLTISEFWKRWHISLSTWFKDYVYIPLGGNRKSAERTYLNLFIVFFISGLWHGASWTFVIWGSLHGFFLIFGQVTKPYRVRIAALLKINDARFLSVLTTFTLVSFAWVFFRATSVESAFFIIKKLFMGIPEIVHKIFNQESVFQPLGLSRGNLLLSVSLIFLLEFVHYLQARTNLTRIFSARPVYVRWLFYYIIFFVILFLGVFEDRQFIYFQF